MRIILLVDESGSMDGIRADTIGSLNQFIRTQKKIGTTESDFVMVENDVFTLVKFNTNVNYVYLMKLYLSSRKELKKSSL